ncbi:cupin-like domain-containing protein [Sphingomonas sp. ZT3P38]|uniref:cupin-like domain-containing protein n=1 Tax=Parasphingomonas zepuensis TaxID=3096161 RepID=UPI002FCC9F12
MALPGIEEIGPGVALDLRTRSEPAILRGIATDWPAVRAADPAAYLARFDTGTTIGIAVAPPAADGWLSYAPGMTALNFTRHWGTLASLFARLSDVADAAEPPAIAAQALAIDEALPGFTSENRIGLVPEGVAPRIWIGNRVRVATHHDMNSNIAVVMAGRRRFTLFPPDQVGNLYIGPFEFTPAGTPVSLVDPDAPDLARFPLAADAMMQARVAELAPGDAIFIPHMWWHHVRSLDPVSILVNYWWNEAPPPQPGLAPIDAMIHAMLTFSGLPETQRDAWRAMFDHVVFGPPADHIPAERRGIRGSLSEDSKERLRRQIAQMMGR